MNCIRMDSSLFFPFKLKLHHRYLPLQNHFRQRPPLTSSHLPLAAVKKRLRKVHCEFEPRVNGALSPNSDSRFLDRQKALEAAMNDINSSFGKGSVTRLGSAGGALVETFPSGCLTLDLALGGGLPKGRIVEVYGPESSGKTTLALHAIAEVQKLGGNAMLVDAEHAFDPAYSKALGVDVENLIVCQPDNGEMALEIADRMCRSGAIDLICVDSVSALTPRAEIEGEIGMQQMGLQARLMSQALRKMSGNASKAGCTLIFLNQIRYKIGVYYGNPEVTSGGIALKFFASVRLEIRPSGKIKSVKGDEDIGLRVRVRVQKSKVSRPYKQAEFEIIFGEGVSKLGCILDCAEMMDVVVKKGSWYSYGEHSLTILPNPFPPYPMLKHVPAKIVDSRDFNWKYQAGRFSYCMRLGQGRDKALQYLRDNPVLHGEIEKIVRSMMADGTLHMSSAPVKSLSLPPQDENNYEEI
ncbi:DNA recombination and repair protein RecA - like 2 [Theobroma cacao]|nr:DNA recombination and repair protein RecA - like 2 [Theobroma cacao]